MAVKYLYDGLESFQPYVEASNIPCGVVINTNTVTLDITYLQQTLLRVVNKVSGGETVAGALSVEVHYANLTTANKQDAIANTSWAESMTVPTTATPYTWKKTDYFWNTEDIAADPFLTTYEISATALYPETQVMYTAIAAGSSTNLDGPSDYVTTDDGSSDANDNNIKWYYYFPGIDASKPEGYMAVRHREAGRDFPNEGAWKISRMAQYPTSST